MRISDWSSDVCSSDLDFHIIDGVDGDTGFAYVSGDAGMVAVIAPVRGQIESDRRALLPGCKIAAIEGIGFFSDGKTGILPDGPRRPRIHAAAYAAVKGAETGRAEGDAMDVLRRIERLNCSPFGRLH